MTRSPGYSIDANCQQIMYYVDYEILRGKLDHNSMYVIMRLVFISLKNY